MKWNNPALRRMVYVGLVLSIMAALVITGCQKKQQVSTEPFRLTINTWVGFAPLYLAKEKGLFKKYGLENVEILKIDDAAARKTSMEAGRIEGYASSVDNWALDSANGVKGKIVMAFDESAGGDGIVAKNDIKTLADLKGKSVAAQPGMPGQFFLFHMLKKSGLSSKDLKLVDMDSDKAGAAFAAGKLDAAVTWEPWLSKSSTAGGHVLVSTKDNRGLIVDVLVVSPDVLAKRSKDVEALTKAWFEALEYWKQNKEESNGIMSKALGLPKEEFAAMCEGVNFFDLKGNKDYFGTTDKKGKIYEVFDSAGSLWLENGIIKSVTKSDAAIEQAILMGIK